MRSKLNAEDDDFFVYGGIYFSTDFNGATYTIEGYSDGNRSKYVGLAYFEWLDDEAVTGEPDSRPDDLE